MNACDMINLGQIHKIPFESIYKPVLYVPLRPRTGLDQPVGPFKWVFLLVFRSFSRVSRTETGRSRTTTEQFWETLDQSGTVPR